MIICDKCFASKEVQQELRRIGHIGNCPTCGHSNSYILDTDNVTEEAPELVEWFGDLLSHFTYEEATLSKASIDEQNLLKTELKESWNIFSDSVREEQVNEIIRAICVDLYKYDRELFEQPVVFREKYDQKTVEDQSLTHGKHWEDFVDEITNENRFHTRTINLEVLDRLLEFLRRTIPAGEVFYRCRINHTDTRYKPKEMGAPPKGMATSGRANAPGISCLYLAKDIRTAIAEVRAGAYDQVTIGRFRLLREIPVIDFRLIQNLCPVGIDMDYTDYAINYEYLKKISSDMARGVKGGDHSVDYVTTQYITDFIKSVRKPNKDGKPENQYWGIIYNSTLHEQGYNLAVFYEDVFKCKHTREYQVKTVQYTTDPKVF